jgi:hypothetical protein
MEKVTTQQCRGWLVGANVYCTEPSLPDNIFCIHHQGQASRCEYFTPAPTKSNVELQENIAKLKPADAQKAAKVPVWQGVFAYFANALQAVGAISKFGCVKHNAGKMPTKWRDYPIETYQDANARHITEQAKGDLYDSESDMLHAAHAAWNSLAHLEKLLEKYPLKRGAESYTHKSWGVGIAATERRCVIRRTHNSTGLFEQRKGNGRRLTDAR